jgi:hypothetical protein
MPGYRLPIQSWLGLPALCLVLAMVLGVAASASGAATAADGEAPQAEVHAEIPLPLSPSWYYTGTGLAASLGTSLAFVGDVNNDGFGDMLVGAPGYDDGVRRGVGRVDAFYGSATGFGDSPSWSIVGGQDGESLGWSVARAGDVNGDGVSDVIVAAPYYDNTYQAAGRAAVYVGSNTGLQESPYWSGEGSSTYAYFGWSVAGVPDVSGDGLSDILVGVPAADGGGHSSPGCANLYFGSSTAIAATPDWQACGDGSYQGHGTTVAAISDVNGDGNQDIAVTASSVYVGEDHYGRVSVYYGMTGSPSPVASWSVMEQQPYTAFGHALSLAGDVNGDGVGDFVVGAEGHGGSFDDEGATFAYYGHTSGLGPEHAWSATGGGESAAFGASVAHAWDLDSDGYSDLAVGAPGHSGTSDRCGRVDIYRGTGDGLTSVPVWSVDGPQYDSLFGAAIALGDIDADGTIDLMVGAPGHNSESAHDGAVFVYLGSGPYGTTFEVDSLEDGEAARDVAPGDGTCADATGACTLRAAIQEANALPGSDTITFALAGEIQIDSGAGPLPPLTESVTIDASGAWNSGGNRPGVILHGGEGNLPGLIVNTSYSRIYGMTITGFGLHGIYIAGSSTVVGAPGAGRRNVLSGNEGTGVAIWGEGARSNVVQSNYIGLAPDGVSPLPNNRGVWISTGADTNLIGGGSDERGNYISGNEAYGVELEAAGVVENLVAGNFIGTAADRVTQVGNGSGIRVYRGEGTAYLGISSENPDTVPGEAPGNLIAGNEGAGILVDGSGGHVLVGLNRIYANGLAGLLITDRAGAAVEGNQIHENEGDGISISGATAVRNSIRYNSIYSNDGSGISLLEGANGGVQPPTIRGASAVTATGTTCAGCTVDLFSDLQDEGRVHEVEVSAEPDGTWSASGAFEGPFLTATSTDGDGNTSEFSLPVSIGPLPSDTPSATSTASATRSGTITPPPNRTPTPSPSPTAGPSPTASETGTATHTPTSGPTPTSSGTPTSGPTATASATPTAGPSPTAGTTEAPSATPTPGGVDTPTPTPAPIRYRIFTPILIQRDMPAPA